MKRKKKKFDIILATAFASNHLLEGGCQVQGFLRLVPQQSRVSKCLHRLLRSYRLLVVHTLI